MQLRVHGSQKHPATFGSSSHAAPQAPPHLPQLPALAMRRNAPAPLPTAPNSANSGAFLTTCVV